MGSVSFVIEYNKGSQTRTTYLHYARIIGKIPVISGSSTSIPLPRICSKSLPSVANALDTAVLPTRTRARAYSGPLVATP